MVDLKQDIQYVKGVGPNKAKLLNKIGIFTLEDMITHYPRNYEDRSIVKQIAEVEDGEEVVIKAICTSRMTEIRKRKNMVIYKLIVRDETGSLILTWYNQKYLKDKFQIGETYKFYGKITRKFGSIEMNSPEFEKEAENSLTRENCTYLSFYI